MKKILTFLLLFVVGLAFLGCDGDDVAPTKVTVNSDKLEYTVGDKFTLTAKVEPSDVTNSKVTWTSSAKEVATVDNQGKAEALKEGSVKFVATSEADPTKKGEITITIKAKEVAPTKVTSIEVKAAKTALTEGEELALEVSVLPANATNKEYTLSSSDEAVLTVADGKVKAVKAGTAKVIATAKDGSEVKGELEFTVTASQGETKVASIEVKAAKTALTEGEELALEIVVLPANATNKEYTLSSSDEAVLTVADGKVKAVKAGTAKVIATAKDGSEVKGELEFTVTEPIEEKLSITGAKKAIEVGAYIELGFVYAAGTETEVVWSSSDETIATVENGDVTAVSQGKVTITCKHPTNPLYTASVEINTFDSGNGLSEFEVIDLLPEYYDIDSYKLAVKIEPSTTLSNYYDLIWTSSDETVATISSNGTLKTLKTGEITITVKDDISEVEHEYTIKVVESPALESLTINGHEITIEETVVLSVKEAPEYANYEITWTALNPEIATIDEKGLVTPLVIGEAEFTATDKVTGISATYKLIINEPFNLDKPPESVTIVIDENKVYVGYKLPLKVEVAPAGVSSAVIWKLHNSSVDFATINEEGILTGIAAGTVRVQAISAVDEKIKSNWVTIKVENPPELPPIPDLKGYEIIMMNADSALTDIDPFLEKYTQADKVYKQKAWTDVQKEYNCTIKVVKYPDVAPWGTARVNWIIDNATAGTSQCDFGMVSGAWINRFSAANAAVDTSDYFRNYGMNQIEAALKEASSAGTKYHAVSMGLSPSRTYIVNGLFYNYGLIKKLGLKTPAELFNDGEWTYDGFYNWCLEAQKLLDEGSYVLAGSPAMYWAGMVNSSGVKLADKTRMELNISHSYSLQAISTLRNLVDAGCYATKLDNGLAVDAACTPFRDQKALFQPGQYWFVNASNRWPSDMWGEGSTEYGYVPFPYPSTVKKEDTKVNFVDESIMMMIAGRRYPAGVDSEGVYRAVQDMYLRTVDAMNKDPLFNAEDTKRSAIMSKISDPASVNATIFYTGSKTMFDPMFDESFQYNYSGPLYTAIVNSINGSDSSQELSAIYDSVMSAFLKEYGSN